MNLKAPRLEEGLSEVFQYADPTNIVMKNLNFAAIKSFQLLYSVIVFVYIRTRIAISIAVASMTAFINM